MNVFAITWLPCGQSCFQMWFTMDGAMWPRWLFNIQRILMSRNEEIQRWHRQYKQETGIKEVDLKEFADWLVAKGWPEPKPVSPRDLLAKQCATALREETRDDKETGEPYRVNHYYVAW